MSQPASAAAPNAPGSDAPFRKRTVIILATVVVVSFISAVIVAIFAGSVTPPQPFAPSTYSRSAIGHGALLAVLRERGLPVIISEHNSPQRAKNSSLFVIAEPVIIDAIGTRARALRDLINQTGTTLVVLPKWYGSPDPTQPEWIDEAHLLPDTEITPVMEAAGVFGELVRPGSAEAVWTTNDFPADPSIGALQLIAGSTLHPVIATDEGILLGWRETADGGWVWVLSDPDVLNNHGLKRGENARLSLAMIDEIRDGSGAIVFDETLHGFQSEPSLWRVLFEFPLALATIQALLTAFLLLWAATRRFGKPVPAAAAIAPGKTFLIDNTAALLRLGRHTEHSLDRYLHTTVQSVARSLNVPATIYGPDQSGDHRDALDRFLHRIEKVRAVSVPLHDLRTQVAGIRSQGRNAEQYAVQVAYRIHRWREEMIHGSERR